MSLSAEAVHAISGYARRADGAAGKTVEIGGETYSTEQLHQVRAPELPEPRVLVVHTLTGFADYITANKDALPLGELAVHVAGHDRVSLLSKLTGARLQRMEYARAVALDRFAAVPEFAFGRWLDPEAMNIALLALFEDSPGRAVAMRILGNITDEGIRTQKDDGVSQTVTVRSGVALVETERVPNPITLRPYRTFVEVEQPASPFVLRLRKGSTGVTAALFEADGGAWKLAAIEDITNYLVGRLPEGPSIPKGLSILS